MRGYLVALFGIETILVHKHFNSIHYQGKSVKTINQTIRLHQPLDSKETSFQTKLHKKEFIVE